MFQPIGLLWGIVTLIFGALVVYPKFLRYTVGIYLVIVGLWRLLEGRPFNGTGAPGTERQSRSSEE
jgi:cytochrome c biogenesis protein CcdA